MIAALAEAVRQVLDTRPAQDLKLFTCAEAAEITGLPRSFFEDETASGHIPSRKVGRHRRLSREDIEAVIAVCAQPPTSGPYLRDFKKYYQQRASAAAA